MCLEYVVSCWMNLRIEMHNNFIFLIDVRSISETWIQMRNIIWGHPVVITTNIAMQNHPWCVCVYRYRLVYLRLFAVIMLAQKKEQWISSITSYNIKRNQLVFPRISFGNGHFPIDSASSFSAMSHCPWFDSQSPESVSSEKDPDSHI